MKRLLLFFSLLLFITQNTNAQSIQLLKKDGSLIVNDTILTNGSSSTNSDVYVYVKNIITKPIDVKVKVHVKNLISGSTATYCWGSNCYGIATLEPTAIATISAGDTIKEFHCDLYPNENPGVYEIMFTFFNKNDIADSASVSLVYNLAATGIESLTALKNSIKSYPNPAANEVHFEYDAVSSSVNSIKIYDLVGKVVKHIHVDRNTTNKQVNISDLQTGIYIWTFESDGKPIKTDRLIKK